jgi:TonB family protein
MKTTGSLLVLTCALGAANTAAQPHEPTTAMRALGQCDITTLQPLPAVSAAAQENVIAAIRQANICVGQQDAACAEAATASVQSLAITEAERALLAIPRAETATLRSDSAAAVAIYEEALALPAIGEFAWRQITWRLAALLNARGEYAETLRMIGSAECEKWTAEAWALRALAYKGLGAHNFALESFKAAMKLYELEGRAVPPTFQEGYQSLLAAEASEVLEGNDIVPISRPNPNYPSRALQNGDEGWVQLEFDVTDMGAVENVRVVAARNAAFDAAAIAALRRWRYVPKFENGLPVRSNGTRTVISFCLDACNFGGNPPPEMPRNR